MIHEPETKAATLPGVAQALYRAAVRARVIAARTRTPLVLSINGKVEKRSVDKDDLYLRSEAALGRREDFERYLKAVPAGTPSETDRIS